MKRKSERAGRRAADLHLWRLVAATVRPLPTRSAPLPIVSDAPVTPHRRPTQAAATPQQRPAIPPRAHPLPAQDIEPARRRRLETGRAPLDGRLDLHGMSQDDARAALTAFVLRGHAEGRRAILVITGKGRLGDGVLRRRAPEWLAQAPLRALVTGLSEAHRRHGGDGALYVTLKRNPRA